MKISIYIMALLVTITVMLAAASTAQASVAANSRIVNEAYLYFDDGTGTIRSVTSKVEVVVTTVSALATMGPVVNASASYAGPATTAIINFTVTANSNGPDQYTLNPAITGGNPTGGSISLPAPFILGATVTASGSTAAVLAVPSDGNGTDGVLNGLTINDTVVINGEARKISAITDAASGTSSLTLSSPLSSPPSAGVPVLEQTVTQVTVTSGTIQASGADFTVPINATVTNSAGTTPSVNASATFLSSSATLVKYVRNVSSPITGSGDKKFIVSGVETTYYRSAITAKPGDTLEYVLEATNAGNAAATKCRLVDTLPGDYVTFVEDAYGAGKDIFYLNESGTGSTLTQDTGDDAATLSGSTLALNVGTGASFVQTGSIPSGARVVVSYRVMVKN